MTGPEPSARERAIGLIGAGRVKMLEERDLVVVDKDELARLHAAEVRCRAALEAEERAQELVNTSYDTDAVMAATMKADRLRREALAWSSDSRLASPAANPGRCSLCRGTGNATGTFAAGENRDERSPMCCGRCDGSGREPIALEADRG